MNNMTVAILDSGISVEKVNFTITGIENIIRAREAVNIDLNGHGTMCAKTIDYIQQNNKYVIVKCLDQNLRGSSEELLRALEYLLYMDVDIVNLSLATNSHLYYKELQLICDKLKTQGKIIVSSVAKNEKNSVPAVFSAVVGVEGRQMERHDSVIYKADKKIQCIADSSPLIIKHNNSFVVFAGHSKAAACLTGVITKKLCQNQIEITSQGKKDIGNQQNLLRQENILLREILVNKIGNTYLKMSKSLLNSGLNKGNINVILKMIENVFTVELPEVITLDKIESEQTIMHMIMDAKNKGHSF